VRTQITTLVNQGWIRPSLSPWGAPVLFQRKRDGKLRMPFQDLQASRPRLGRPPSGHAAGKRLPPRPLCTHGSPHVIILDHDPRIDNDLIRQLETSRGSAKNSPLPTAPKATAKPKPSTRLMLPTVPSATLPQCIANPPSRSVSLSTFPRCTFPRVPSTPSSPRGTLALVVVSGHPSPNVY
jgi:hypothetical protein